MHVLCILIHIFFNPLKKKNFYIDLFTPFYSILSSVSLIPAVSYNIIGNSDIFNTTDNASLVVPAISLTIAISLLASVFKSVLLPEFGLPFLNFT